MKPRVALLALLAVVLLLGHYARHTTPTTSPSDPDLIVSGPYSHENLTVFLFHGPDAAQSRNVLTLQEAIEQKLVVVHETGSVNELAVENQSLDSEVFLQSGDIVKGGRQGRSASSKAAGPAGTATPPRSSTRPPNKPRRR